MEAAVGVGYCLCFTNYRPLRRQHAKIIFITNQIQFTNIVVVYFTLSFLYSGSVQDVVAEVVVVVEEDFLVRGSQLLLLLQRGSQHQPLRLNPLLLCRRILPPNKAGECYRESVLPLLRVWHLERDPQLLTEQSALLPTHLVEVMKPLWNSNRWSLFSKWDNNNNLLGPAQLIRKCFLIV